MTITTVTFLCPSLLESARLNKKNPKNYCENLGYIQSYLFNCFVKYFKRKHVLFVLNKQICQTFQNKDENISAINTWH